MYARLLLALVALAAGVAAAAIALMLLHGLLH
jgi:hypothetical protein